MATFRVLLTRDTTESTSVIVETAHGAQHAITAAFSLAQGNPGLTWEPDDSAGFPYLGDPENAAEEIDAAELAAEQAAQHVAEGQASFAQAVSIVGASQKAARVAAAAKALLDAFGGDVPHWLYCEAQALTRALEA